MAKNTDLALILALVVIGMFIPFLGSIALTYGFQLGKIATTFGYFLLIFCVELGIVYLYFVANAKFARKKMDDYKPK